MQGPSSFLMLAAGTACREMLQGLLRDCCPSWYQGHHQRQRQSIPHFHCEFLSLCPSSHSYFHFLAQCLKTSHFCFPSSPSAPEKKRIVKNINRNNTIAGITHPCGEKLKYISLFMYSLILLILCSCHASPSQKHIPSRQEWAPECAGLVGSAQGAWIFVDISPLTARHSHHPVVHTQTSLSTAIPC